MPSANKSKKPSHQVFWCVCAIEVKQNPASDASETEKGNGDVRDCNRTRSYTYSSSITCTSTPLYVLQVSSLSLFQVQHTWYLVSVHANTQQTAESEVRGSLSRVKTSCGQGLPHYVELQAEQRLSREKAKRSFPMERGSTAKHHPAANPQCSQRFRAEEFLLLCPKPKVMPRWRSAVAAVAQMDRHESYLARCGTR